VADDPFSLDFTHFVPPPPPQPERAAEAVAVAPAAKAPEPANPLREAALLFAARKDVEACHRLEAALKNNEVSGADARPVWQALFELLQLLERRKAFDTLALAYAKRFESSPPAWVERGATEGLGYDGEGAEVVLTGCVDAGSGDALKQMLRTAAAAPLVGIDLTAVTDVDDAGASLLLRAAAALRKAGKECVLDHPDGLADRLAARLVTGERANENIWLLLLQLYQQAGRQDAFDEAAVNYAVTFERSPPSYEPPPSAHGAAKKPPADDVPPPAQPLALRGEIDGAQPGRFDAIAHYAGAADEIATLDASGLVRINADAIAELKTALAALGTRAAGVRITGLAQIVSSLLAAHGIDKLAQLRTRQF
jgi:anti-anti-sigma regulatory factor